MTSEEFRNNPLFLRNQFDGNGTFEMPVIQKQDVDLDNVSLIGYDKTKSGDKAGANSFVHFFLDDYKFEVIWNDPEPRLEKLSQYRGVLSPQFSTYYTMPVPLQIYNTFRSRWCGAYLQSKGFKVIPTVSWGLPQSYWYCFDGIEKGSVVAVSTLGVRKEKDFFLQGYSEMLRRLKPKAVICYNTPFDEMGGNIITVSYEETNNIEHNKSSFNRDSYYIKKTMIVIDSTAKGGGGGGGGGGSGGKNPFKSPKSGSGKEKATDVPSWAKGNRPYKNENGNQFAKRLCDERFGKGNYDKGPRSDFNRIRKWGDRGFE